MGDERGRLALIDGIPFAKLDTLTIPLSRAPQVHGGQLYVPLQFVSDVILAPSERDDREAARVLDLTEAVSFPVLDPRDRVPDASGYRRR